MEAPADLKLTRQQTKVLMYVRMHPGAAVWEIAQEIGCRPYWAYQALDALKRFRWVTVEHDEGAGAYLDRWTARSDY